MKDSKIKIFYWRKKKVGSLKIVAERNRVRVCTLTDTKLNVNYLEGRENFV